MFKTSNLETSNLTELYKTLKPENFKLDVQISSKQILLISQAKPNWPWAWHSSAPTCGVVCSNSMGEMNEHSQLSQPPWHISTVSTKNCVRRQFRWLRWSTVNHLGPSQTFSTHFGKIITLSDCTSLSHLGPSQTILDHLVPSQKI